MITPGDHLKLTANPEAVAVDLELNAALPLSYQRPCSQAERHLIHVERRINNATGAVDETPRLNRKGRRKTEALERRKFKPATRPLNKHELQQLMLNKYEDSLERPDLSRRSKKRKQQKKTNTQPVAEVDTTAAPENSRMRRLARRATERALQAIGF